MASLGYDPASTVLYVRMKRGKVAKSKPLADNIILDLNAKNELLGIEVSDLGQKTLENLNQKQNS